MFCIFYSTFLFLNLGFLISRKWIFFNSSPARRPHYERVQLLCCSAGISHYNSSTSSCIQYVAVARTCKHVETWYVGQAQSTSSTSDDVWHITQISFYGKADFEVKKGCSTMSAGDATYVEIAHHLADGLFFKWTSHTRGICVHLKMFHNQSSVPHSNLNIKNL